MVIWNSAEVYDEIIDSYRSVNSSLKGHTSGFACLNPFSANPVKAYLTFYYGIQYNCVAVKVYAVQTFQVTQHLQLQYIA